ncbi:MAG TPA: hypothetical protein VH234_05735 [Candidatus Saccharimonadales bacterium]|jgi:hypothetical protein|nr:hypothetical protein [Candidatus Saccharimonadales bacterium]
MIEAAFRQSVLERQENFSTYKLPKLDDLELDEVFERIRTAERIVCPDETREAYQVGGATENNELLVIQGINPVLLTAEHATSRIRYFRDERPSRQDPADQGTFGLSWVTRQDTDSSIVAALGRQTGDANYDIDHPLKEAMRPIICSPEVMAHLSVHRMFRGRVATPCDEQAFNIIFGIGDRPSEATKDFIDKAKEVAKKYDLRSGVNQSVIQFGGDTTPKRNEDGSFKTIILAAKGPGTTRTFSQAAGESINRPFIAAQLELASSILLQPSEHGTRRNFERQRAGVYLGYLFLRECVSIAATKI